jgi:hypothetical protein
MIKGLMKQVRARNELLEQQEELLVQGRKISEELKNREELKKLLDLEKARWRSLIKNLLKARRLLIVSRAQLVLFKVNMISCQRHIKIIKCNLMLFGQAPPRLQSTMKPP